MAGDVSVGGVYYRNYDENDSTSVSISIKISPVVLSYDSSQLNFSAPEGKVFKEWNSTRDGSGVSHSVGESIPNYPLYAIWEEETPITYYVTGTELTAVADAIRTKGDTSAALEWPSGFISAIDAVSGGGSGGAAAGVSVKWAFSPIGPGAIGPVFYYVGSDGAYHSYECEEMNSSTPLSVLAPSIIAVEGSTLTAKGSIDTYSTPNYYYKLAFVYGEGELSAESG